MKDHAKSYTINKAIRSLNMKLWFVKAIIENLSRI